MKYQSQRGVALVITLIMLSVITFLTVAFLAISRRDRASVTTSLSQTDSHLMADTALARMQSELTARMMARGTLLSYDLMISTNYINPLGFDPAITTNNTNNVNYDHTTAIPPGPLNNDDWIRNIGNLFFDPRPPVFVKTNADGTLPLDFRFYLDYNRNRRFETNGGPLMDNFDVPIGENGLPSAAPPWLANPYIGEPQWIGVLQNPEYPHSPTNRFIGRYLYLALPISRTLDWNYIHNYAKGNVSSLPTTMNGRDGFFRNQGFGSWEINLGAFLNDLNTNSYGISAFPPVVLYNYVADPANPNDGDAFADALSFLRYRYNANHTHPNIGSVLRTFGAKGNNFQTDLIDGYSSRPVFVAPFVNTTDPDFNLVTANAPWAGSKNPKKFYEPQELFDTNKTFNFATRLQKVVTNNNSYDRYTFSRLLEQIGMGSEPEVLGKININYTNNPAVNIVDTNFVEWITPLQFFTNAAARLIRDNVFGIPDVPNNVTNYYIFNTNNPVNPKFALTNIQIYPTNEYTAQLHRLLQVAANVYDATTTNRFPSVFRPQFATDNNGTNYISGYEEITNNLMDVLTTNGSALTLANNWTNREAPSLDADNNVFGIPFVIGAKKGFPNFNKFIMQSSVQVSRNLQIIKSSTNPPPITFLATNQMLSLGISNVLALQAWNSYTNAYRSNFLLFTTNYFSAILTNETGKVLWPTNGQTYTNGRGFYTNYSYWEGARPFPANSMSNSLIVPLYTNIICMSNLHYRSAGGGEFTSATNYETTVEYTVPSWFFHATNRLFYVLIDQQSSRIIDLVNLESLATAINIGEQLIGSDLPGTLPNVPTGAITAIRTMWRTNRIGGSTLTTVPTVGMVAQIQASMGVPELQGAWNSYGNQDTPTAKEFAIAGFRKFMGLTPASPYSGMEMPPYTNAQTPFNPVRSFDQTLSWEANDPLVHYMANDLLSTNPPPISRVPPNGAPEPPIASLLKRISNNYRPWGRKPNGGNAVGPLTAGNTEDGDFAYDFRVKDPRVRWSDDWDFPTNKFPSIGWLGRVHRGTPWQTIYLKGGAITNRSSALDDRTPEEIGPNWHEWAGNIESHPTNDWHLLDVFTAAANDNAARGLLSVNQTNQAAWSAVLSGVVVLTNSLSDSQVVRGQTNTAVFQSLIIPPGPTIEKIVTELNAIRATKPNGVFTSMGQILEAPSFSVSQTNGIVDSSPYLNVTNYTFDVNTNKVIDSTLNQNQRFYGVTDEAYERIPRQIMSLLKLGEPRFVVYCYGQSLKPAPNSIVLSPPAGSGLFNLCTNYQITGEVVTRTTLRVEGSVQSPKTVIETYNVLPANE